MLPPCRRRSILISVAAVVVLGCENATEPQAPEPPAAAAAAAATFNLTRIATGSTHSCGLDANGQAYCWGFDVAMGDGSSSASMVPTPVAVAGGHRFVEVRPGNFHT